MSTRTDERVPPELGSAVPAQAFRSAISHFTTGVAVVGVYDEVHSPHGMTVNSLVSVSLEPASLLVSLKPGRTHDLLQRAGWFSVSILTQEQQEWSRLFAGARRDGASDLFVAGRHAPLLRGALAGLECRLDKTLEVFDHTLFIGRVVDCLTNEGTPLTFYAGRYREPQPS